RQRQTDVPLQPMPRTGEQKSLLMGRQQHVELPARQELLDEREISGGVGAQPRAAMKLADEARVARQAPRRGIADLDVMARQTQNCDGLAARGTGTFGDEYPERFCRIGHAVS